MALSCLAGNPLTTSSSRPSCPGSTASSGRGALKEDAEPATSTPSTSPIEQADLHESDQEEHPIASSGTKNGMSDQHHGGSGGIMSAPSPVNGPAGSGAGQLPSLSGNSFQQQQQQQAAIAAAGLFRLGSGYPGGIVPPHHLPSLMASLQAVAGVPLHHGPLPAGLGGLLPGGLPFNFPSMSHQHQNALLNWSKLAQAAALGVAVSAGHHHHHVHDGLGSLIAQQHSPDSSSSGRSGGKKKQANLGYTAGLIVKEASPTGGLSNKKAGTKTVKAQVARRNAKNSSKTLLDLETTDSGKLIIEPPIMVSSPVGTESSPPSINGSGSGLHNKSSSGSSTRSNHSSATPAINGSSGDSSMIKADGSGGKVFSCSICHRTFGYKHVLQNHERTHTGEKPFECKQCGKRFTRDHHLKTHMRLHTGEKPYNCTHCDRQFVQVANLRRHLRVHTGERPYACELCTSRFSDSNQLKAHMLIHKGEKPFECQLCSGKFRRRHHLMHHKCPKDPAKHLVSKMLSSIQHHQTEDDMESEPPPTPSSYASPPDEEDEEDELLLDDEEELSVTPKKPARERKPKETRRVVRPAPPEQTEPEDLSNKTSGGSRIRHASTFSVGSTGGWSAAGSVSIGLSSDDDDEIEDDMSDTEDMILERASKKQRRGIDQPLRHQEQTHQV